MCLGLTPALTHFVRINMYPGNGDNCLGLIQFPGRPCVCRQLVVQAIVECVCSASQQPWPHEVLDALPCVESGSKVVWWIGLIARTPACVGI